MSALVEAEVPAKRFLPVPKETIYPGEVVTSDRLTDREFMTTSQSLAGVATSAADIVGKETRRRLVVGMPVLLGGLGVPLAIRRGTSTTAYFRDDSFTISTQVIALSDGAEGDVIDARSLEAGAVIKVTVLAGGELSVLGE
ncbi:MAG: flagellar basal body P-ring formation chaperone FlgA [Verrucomicrobiaceae bacterium]